MTDTHFRYRQCPPLSSGQVCFEAWRVSTKNGVIDGAVQRVRGSLHTYTWPVLVSIDLHIYLYTVSFIGLCNQYKGDEFRRISRGRAGVRSEH